MANTDPAWADELERIERQRRDLTVRLREPVGETYGSWTPDEIRALLTESAVEIERLRRLASDARKLAGWIVGYWPGLEDAIDWDNPDASPMFKVAKRIRAAPESPVGEEEG